MKSMKFEIQGSSSEPYEVEFVLDEGGLMAFCTCQAGIHGSFCKHRVAILAMDNDAIENQETQNLELLKKWLSGTKLEAALQEFLNAQTGLEESKRRLKRAKLALSRVMHGR